jgi:hypothetical protein
MYLSATSAQVKNQFFASLERLRSRPALAGWTWLETEVRNPHGGFLFGRATDTSGNIEGLHDQPGSPAAILVDEVKSIRDEVLDALERCHTSYRLFMSSTGQAFGGFYGTIHFEALGGAAVFLGKAHVVKHGPDVKQLGIELQFLPQPSQRAEIINSGRMVE